MIINESALLQMAIKGGLVILSISITMVLYRIIKGPEHADRIIALDLLSILLIALVTLYSLHTNEEAYLDVVMAYALVAFLGTVAFARYLERSTLKRNRDKKQDIYGDGNG